MGRLAMRLFPPPLEIGEQEGFSKDKDIFGRGAIGTGLLNVVCRVSDPLVIAIDSEWGTGKTTFLKMWAGDLRRQHIPVVFFDAFEHDYVDDAFTAIAGEIISLATEQRKQTDPKTKKFVKSSLGAAKILLRSGLKVGVKLATAGALDAAELGNAANEIAKELSDLDDKYIGELLTEHKQEKMAIQSFRDALELLPSLLSPPTDEAESKSKPLIIIVDELDRCRPTFALQILERIKHFFTVPGVHFILGTHLGQLRNSISAVYGPGIDSSKYLQKFIGFTLHLTDGETQPHRRTSTVYIDYLMSVMLPEHRQERIFEYASHYLHHLAHHSRLSLRSIERIISGLAVSLAYRPKNAFCPDALLIGLCALKVLDSETYVRAKSGERIFGSVREPLALAIEPEQRNKHEVEHFTKTWRYYADPAVADDNPDYRGFGHMLGQINLERWDVVPFVARSYVDRMTEHGS